MATLAVPGADKESRRPLSNHGLPKPPRVTSPGFPHRFTAGKSPSTTFVSGFASPRTPGLMSPPMSARSFGTFIDSEPSTPAYSPRVDYDWDDSTLVLLRPISSSSEPSSPTEPTWDMVVPMESSKQPTALYESAQKGPLATTRKPFLGTRLASPPVKKPKTPRKAQPAKEVQAADISQKENDDPHKDEENDKVKEHLEQPADSSTAPFGKLASKMKLMLRRRSATNDKKKEKREKDYYDPEENLHWSER